MKKPRSGKRKARGIRDFHRKRYGNPLFQGALRGRRSMRARRRFRVRHLVPIAGGSLVIGVMWLLFWGPAFSITDVKLTGATPETEEAIRSVLEGRLASRSLGIFPQRSIFLFDKEKAGESIGRSFFLEKLEIRKRLPHELIVDVGEKPVVALLLSENRFLGLEDSGIVVRELTERESLSLADLPESLESAMTGELGAESVEIADIEGGGPSDDELSRNRNPHPLILLESRSVASLDPGVNALPAPVLRLILQANARLPDLTGSGVRWFAVDTVAESVEILLREGWSVYFSTTLPFDVQSERLVLILKEKIGSRRPELQYVDLRYNERIFFKFFGTGE